MRGPGTNAICLVVDRLHAGYLGCYGNSWIATPALDQLAFEGFVWDQALIDGPRLESLYRGYWQGLHALAGPRPEIPSLAQLLAAGGVSTTLITDEPAVAGHPLTQQFQEAIVIPPATEPRTAAEPDETQIALLLSTVAEWLAVPRSPFLLWVHAQGMAAPWDAPYAFRQRYGEGDIEVPTGSEVPHLRLPPDFDPDELLGIRWAYAGQVSLLDLCLAGLLELLQATGRADDTLLMFLSARSFPLGEHRQLGWPDGTNKAPPPDEPLHEELIHVPWLIRFPGGFAQAGRSQALVQPADLPWTLLDWWGLEPERFGAWGRSLLPGVSEEREAVRDRACVWASPHERGIRTDAWYLRLTSEANAQEPSRRLYAKPDDRWEVNEVSDRAPGVADLLAQALLAVEEASRREEPFDLPPLERVLVAGLE